MRLANKRIIVTGSGGGIGEGIAKRLCAEGAHVIVADINLDGAKRVAAEIVATGHQATAAQVDVTDNASMKSLIDFTVSQLGGLDVMVNNAGWTHKNQSMLETTEADFDKVYAINVKSIYLSALHATPVFKGNKDEAGKSLGGAFINIASTAGLRPRPGLTWYNGSKAAVIGTSKSMATELGSYNIRVNCINPVFNPDTGLSTAFAGGDVHSDADRHQRFLSTIPLGRFSTALDVANAALYLASDEAAFISGVCLEVDGARCV